MSQNDKNGSKKPIMSQNDQKWLKMTYYVSKLPKISQNYLKCLKFS